MSEARHLVGDFHIVITMTTTTEETKTKRLTMLLLVVLMMTSVSGDQSASDVRRGNSDVIDDDGK